MKAILLVLTAILPVVGCQSHNPKTLASSEYGYTYDLLVPPGIDRRVAKMANLTPTPKATPVAEVATSPPESPDVGVVTFYQAPGTPPKTNSPRVYVPAPRPVQTAPMQPQAPAQQYYPQGYYQPYQQPYQQYPYGSYNPYGYYGYDAYGNGYGYGYPYGYGNPYGYQDDGYGSGGSAYAYSDLTVVYGGTNGFYNPYTSYGPNNGQSYGLDGRINGGPPFQQGQTNHHRPGFVPSGGFNPVPGATNTGFIPRFNVPPPGTPPGTQLIDNRPFGQPPGTQFLPQGTAVPPGIGFNNPPQMMPGPLAPPSGQPFNPAIGAPQQSFPRQLPAINRPPSPPRPVQQVQPVLPGAMPIPQGRVQSGGGSHGPAPRAMPPPPPASSSKK